MDWPWSETTVSVSTSPYKPTALLLSPQLHQLPVFLSLSLSRGPTYSPPGDRPASKNLPWRGDPRAGEWWSFADDSRLGGEWRSRKCHGEYQKVPFGVVI